MSGRGVTIVASEVLGRAGTGGAGTADSLLAIALGRHGHSVELLVASGREVVELRPEWARAYASAGVTVRDAERAPATPAYLAPALGVLHELRRRPPEVAIVNDWRGLGYFALTARQVALALPETAFVVHCHGPARVLAEFAQKVPDTVARFGEEVTERGSIDLADAVVSPSEWLLDWMRRHGWPVPASASVIPYIRRSVAFGEEPPPAPERTHVKRLAFFGQLREGKGVRIYLEALNALEPSLLEGVELLFLGRETPRWNGAEIERALHSATRAALADVRIEASLDREQALAELRRPATLALMPSLLDNSPNTVSECIETGVPFLSTRTGGIPELVAKEDRARVLCEPTADGLARSLRDALRARDGFAPARPAQDPTESLRAWLDLVDSVTPAERPTVKGTIAVDLVALSDESAGRARVLAEHSSLAEPRLVRTESRRSGLERSSSEWILFLDNDDLPEDDLVDRLVAAQQASGADVVTCAVRPEGAGNVTRLFLGDPGSLGLAENLYGVLGLVRRSLVVAEWPIDGATDPEWALLARLALGGARIVSIPEPLAVHRGRPGRVSDVPGDGLAVLEAFEADGRWQRDLPQLAGTLAAALARVRAEGSRRPLPERVSTRGLRVLREEGPGGVVKRARRRLRRGR